MNVTIRWVKDGEVQNGYVEGAVSEIVESSAYVPTQDDLDREKIEALRKKGALSDAEKDEAIMLLLKYVR